MFGLSMLKKGGGGADSTGYTATLQTGPDTTNKTWQGLAWSPDLGLWCAVSGDTGSGVLTKAIITSPDGINWTYRSSPATPADTNGYYAIAWSPELELFAAVGAGIIRTSPDGINWTDRTCPVSSSGSSIDKYGSVVWVPEESKFIAVRYLHGHATNYYRYLHSTNGITWTGVNTGLPPGTAIHGVVWGPGPDLLVAIRNSTSTIISTSPADVISWSNQFTTLQMAWNGIAYSATLGLYVAVGYDPFDSSNARVYTATDPTGTWTSRTPGANNQWQDVVWAPELGEFWAVANSGAGNRLMNSPDGINWTEQVSAGDYDWRTIEWSPELCQLCCSSYINYRFMTIEPNTNVCL